MPTVSPLCVVTVTAVFIAYSSLPTCTTACVPWRVRLTTVPSVRTPVPVTFTVCPSSSVTPSLTSSSTFMRPSVESSTTAPHLR